MKLFKNLSAVFFLILTFGVISCYGQGVTYTPFYSDEGAGYYLTYDLGGGQRQVALYAYTYSANNSITITSSSTQSGGVWDNKAGATVVFVKAGVSTTVTYNGVDAKKLFNSLGWPDADGVWSIPDSNNSSLVLTLEKDKTTEVSISSSSGIVEFSLGFSTYLAAAGYFLI